MIKTIVQSAREKYLIDKENSQKEERNNRDFTPALWPSDMLDCPRKAAYHLINHGQTVSKSAKSLVYMSGGNVLEDDTGRALKAIHNAEQDFPLKVGNWSGKADFIIGHNTPDVTIIEHKATGEGNFKRSSALPKREHVAQLALYGHLYKRLYGIEAKLILYYRGWGHYAELEITPNEKNISIVGVVDGTFVNKTARINILEEIEKLESMYQVVMSGGSLPDKLSNKSKCEFMGKPNCPYYLSCWGNA